MRPKKPDDHEDAKAPALSDQAPDVAKEKIPKAEAPHLNVAGARQTGNALKGTKEGKRVEEDRVREKHWKRWGPYLAERQWVSLPYCRRFWPSTDYIDFALGRVR